MDNVTLEPLEHLHQQFLRMADQLSALQELAGLRLSGATDPARLAQEALSILILRNDFHACSLFVRKEDHLRCIAGVSRSDLLAGHPPPDPQPHVFRLEEGIAGTVAASGRMRHSRDTRFDPRFVPLPERDVGSLISIPLRDAREIIGVLNVSHPRHKAFDENHERFLDVFAAFLAQLLTHWRLTHRLEAMLQERTQALEATIERLEVRERWHEQTALLDPVTGLHNARFLSSELRRLGARASRSGAPLALLLIALETHPVESRSLKETARHRLWSLAAGLLRTQVREGDVLCHLGQGLFALCLPEDTVETAGRLADRIRHDLGALHYRIDEGEIGIAPKFGMADARPEEDREEEREIDVAQLQARAMEDLKDRATPET